MTLCKFFTLLFAHSTIWQICLVSTEYFHYIRASMSFNLLQPILYIVIRTLFSTVISEDNSHSSLIVCLSNGAESLLTSSIPDLELYTLSFNLHSLNLEVNAYGRHVCQRNVTLREPEQDATLTNVGVTDND